MKIANQFVTSPSSVSPKTSYSIDNGADFHSAFHAATKESVSSNGLQVKTKAETRDTKPQTSESKKKEPSSETAAAIVAMPGAPAPKESASDAASLATIGSPVKEDASAQSFDKGLNATISATGRAADADNIAITGAPIAASAPLSDTGAPKAANAGEGTDSSKSGDLSKPNADAVDPGVMAAQEQAALKQSVSAPSLPGSLVSGIEFQATRPIATSKIAAVNPAAEMVKGAGSGQADSPTKAKPAASDAKSKRADDAGSDSQSSNAAVGTAATFAAKVSEASATVNHGAGEFKGALDTTGLQQVTPAAQSNVSSHGPDTAQSTNLSAEPTIQPAQAPAETQAMQGVSSAQLVQSMHSSEMKLGMQSAEFGNISISTSLNHQALSAQISIDHSELGRALAVHLPAIEEKLGSAYGVQAKVELRDTNNPSSSSNESGYSNSGQQSREQRQSQTDTAAATGQGAMYQRIASLATSPTTSVAASTSRLDIRI